MKKTKRNIIKIDEELCNGCGTCVPSCVEQALQIIDTPKGKKARLVKEIFCDGLGACLGACPTGALVVEEREAEAFNEEATKEWLEKVANDRPREKPKVPKISIPKLQESKLHKIQEPKFSCPSTQIFHWTSPENTSKERIRSELRQWPIQLNLVPPSAPYFKNSDLLIVADCVPFTYPNFHQDFLKNHVLVIGCPKLDDVNTYVDKIAEIIKIANPKSIEVVHMEVPCCFGLIQIVQQAIDKVGKKIPTKSVKIGIKGDLLS